MGGCSPRIGQTDPDRGCKGRGADSPALRVTTLFSGEIHDSLSLTGAKPDFRGGFILSHDAIPLYHDSDFFIFPVAVRQSLDCGPLAGLSATAGREGRIPPHFKY